MVSLLLLTAALGAAPTEYPEAVAKYGTKDVLVLVQANPRAEKYPVALGLRSMLQDGLRAKKIDLVDSEPAEAILNEVGVSGQFKPVQVARLRTRHHFTLLLSGIYIRNGEQRKLQLILVDSIRQKTLWTGVENVPNDRLESLYSPPEVNLAVIGFAKDNAGKQVGNGECWTFIDEALKAAGSKWEMDDLFTAEGGKGIVKDAPRVFPGDVVTLDNVTISCGGITMFGQHHYAIVSKVFNSNSFEVMHQNFGGRTVTTTWYDIAGLSAGTMRISRPTR